MNAVLRSRRRYYGVPEFARLTGLPAATVRARCESGVYATRAGHDPGRHWEILARELRAELRKMGRG